MKASRAHLARRLGRGIGLLSVGSLHLQRGLIPKETDVRPSRDLVWLTSSHFLRELLELALLPSTAKRATR